MTIFSKLKDVFKGKHLELKIVGAVAGAIVLIVVRNAASKQARAVERIASSVQKDYDELPAYETDGVPVTCQKDSTAIIRYSKKGVAAEQALTVMQVFERAAVKWGDKDAMCVKRNGVWKRWTWGSYHTDVLTAGRALMALGVEAFDSVNILGFNSPEWFIADLAAIACGAKAAGIYSTNLPPACEYIASHSKARVIFTEDKTQTAKILSVAANLPDLLAIVQWTGEPRSEAKESVDPRLSLLSWEEFMAKGVEVTTDALQKRIDAQSPGHCCTLIYTSGTTGNPKAVMISHDNLTWTSRATLDHVAETGWGSGEESLISYLPLSHIAAQLLDIHAPMSITAFRKGHVCVWFAQPDALKGSLGTTLKEVRPTVFLGVPRVWEKFQEKLLEIGKQTKGIKKVLSTWAKKEGQRATFSDEFGSLEGGQHSLSFKIANRLVLSKIHAALGLDRCKMMASAAAPMPSNTWLYFASLYVRIFDLYGMSECTGPQTCSVPSTFARGYAGTVIKGTEVKLVSEEGRDKPGEGEICYRGRHIMMGYLDDEVKTAATIDSEGWLHSGDKGMLDPAMGGMLKITGRVKELLITAGGENVAPVPIEDALKTLLPAVSQVMVIGDGRKYLSCIFTLNCEPDPNTEGGFTDKLSGSSVGVSARSTTCSDASKDLVWHSYIQAGVDAYNKNHAVSRAQKIASFVILDRDFSMAGSDPEITPTQKLKRAVVMRKYQSTIDTVLYGASNMRKNQSAMLSVGSKGSIANIS